MHIRKTIFNRDGKIQSQEIIEVKAGDRFWVDTQHLDLQGAHYKPTSTGLIQFVRVK